MIRTHTVTIEVSILKSKRLNAKQLYKVTKSAYIKAVKSNAKSSITLDNLAEIENLIKTKFEAGNVIVLKLSNTYYGYNSKLSNTLECNDNGSILAIRNLVMTANGQVAHIKSLLRRDGKAWAK